MKKVICYCALIVLSLVSCTLIPQQLPTTTPVLFSTQIPTFVPTTTPTQTPHPTATSCVMEPNSVSTLRSVQDRTAALIPNARVTWYEDFHCNELNNGWGVSHDNPTTSISVANGAVMISVQKVEGIWEGMSRGSNS